MDRKYLKKRGRLIYNKALAILLFAFLSFGAVRIGMGAGNFISGREITVVEKIHVQTFKDTLNRSLPVIGWVYNSGHSGISVQSELRGVFKLLFGFDLSNPITIFNAQSPFLYSYYDRYSRQLALAEQGKADEYDRSDGSKAGDNPIPKEGNGQGKTAQSYAYYDSEEYDEENRDRSDKDLISAGKIRINNQTAYRLDEETISSLLKEPLNFDMEDKGPQVLIYHTHTTEAYLRNIKELNDKSLSNRDEKDLSRTVVKVGDELAEILRKKYDIDVMHNGTINDKNFNDSYNMGYKTVTSILKGNPSIKVVIDLHRDGLASNKPKLRPVTKIDGKNVAQIMFVVGTDERRNHKQWRENFKFALKLHQKLNDKYPGDGKNPGLMRPMLLSYNCFNQNVSNGAIIIEVGADGNTVEESLESVKYLARAISEVLNNN